MGQICMNNHPDVSRTELSWDIGYLEYRISTQYLVLKLQMSSECFYPLLEESRLAIFSEFELLICHISYWLSNISFTRSE